MKKTCVNLLLLLHGLLLEGYWCDTKNAIDGQVTCLRNSHEKKLLVWSDDVAAQAERRAGKFTWGDKCSTVSRKTLRKYTTTSEVLMVTVLQQKKKGVANQFPDWFSECCSKYMTLKEKDITKFSSSFPNVGCSVKGNSGCARIFCVYKRH